MSTPSRVPRYVPILKGRAGELAALQWIQPRTRSAMVPLVEVAPKDESEDPAAALKICEQAVGKLARALPGRVMLDGGLFDLSAEVVGGLGIVGVLADKAREEGLDAQPVLRLGDPDRAVLEAGRAHSTDGHGLSIRIVGEDLDEDPDDLDEQLGKLIQTAGVSPQEVDLLLDLGPVEGDVAVRGGARLVVSLVRDLPTIDEWRSVTVASGAFPVDLSQFTPYVIGERPRYDAQVFDQVHKRRLPRRLDYGDYGVAHPALAIGNVFAPPPQLRYTASEHWLVLKGRKNDPLGNAQFQRICQTIAAHPDFAGVPVGNADRRIADGSQEGPGNGTTWRTVGTTHHLDYVTLRLTSMGEP